MHPLFLLSVSRLIIVIDDDETSIIFLKPNIQRLLSYINSIVGDIGI